MVEHEKNKLKLQAFDGYYSCRVLVDLVTIWIVNDEKMENPSLSSNAPIQISETTSGIEVSIQAPNATQASQHSRTEDGCLFALFNHHAKHPLTRAQRCYITELIQPQRLLDVFQKKGSLRQCRSPQLITCLESRFMPIW